MSAKCDIVHVLTFMLSIVRTILNSSNFQPYHGIRSSAGTASPGLYAEHIVEKGCHKVVVQEAAGVGVQDEEGEDGQARGVQVA